MYTEFPCLKIFPLHNFQTRDCPCILANTFGIGLLLLICPYNCKYEYVSSVWRVQGQVVGEHREEGPSWHYVYCTLHYTLYSTLYTVLYTIHCTLHYTLWTLHWTIYTEYGLLHTLHCTLPYTLHTTQYPIHCKLFTVHCTPCTLYTSVSYWGNRRRLLGHCD